MKKFYVTQEQYDNLSTIIQDQEPYRFTKNGIEYIRCGDNTCFLEIDNKIAMMQSLMAEREKVLNHPTRRALLEANAPICNCGGRTKLINHDAMDVRRPNEKTARWKCYKCKTKFIFEPRIVNVPKYFNEPKPTHNKS